MVGFAGSVGDKGLKLRIATVVELLTALLGLDPVVSVAVIVQRLLLLQLLFGP